MALTGNTYLEHPVAEYDDERFLKLVRFLRGTDAALTNMECALQDGEDWPAYVAGMGWSATYMGGRPSMIDDMKFMGIKAIYAANNHVVDFGENGILTTIKYLRQRGLPYAGIGASLTEATEACYFDTSGGRRVALIAAVDWGPRGVLDLPFPWPVGYMPSDDGPPFKRRPGVNLLRYDAVYHVTRDTLEQLKKTSRDYGWEAAKAARFAGGYRDHPVIGPRMIGWEKDTDTEFFFMGRKFALSDQPRISTFCYQEDLDRIFKHVREARRQADIVIVGLHDQSHGPAVHDYLRVFAQGCIDNGADIYLNHAGRFRGTEVYKNKVILWGQPGLFLQNEQVTHVPSSLMPQLGQGPDNTAADFLEARERNEREASKSRRDRFGPGGSAVNVVAFDLQNRIKEVRVQPLEVMGGPRFRKGLPRMPEPGSEVVKGVLDWVAERSKPFGTAVEVREGVGIIPVK